MALWPAPFAVSSLNDWGPFDVFIFGPIHFVPWHIYIGLNAMPHAPRAVVGLLAVRF